LQVEVEVEHGHVQQLLEELVVVGLELELLVEQQ
jgi:hypothetical protein